MTDSQSMQDTGAGDAGSSDNWSFLSEAGNVFLSTSAATTPE